MDIWKQSFGISRNNEVLDCARIRIADNCGRDNKEYKKSKRKIKRSIVMDNSFQIRRLPVLDAKLVLKNMVYGQIKIIDNELNSVAWVMIITQKIAKEEENVEYQIVTRTIKERFSEERLFDKKKWRRSKWAKWSWMKLDKTRRWSR